jgi:hypothetical protein
MSHLNAGGSRVALAGGMTDSSCSYGLNGRPRVKLTVNDRAGSCSTGREGGKGGSTVGCCEQGSSATGSRMGLQGD